MKAGVLHEAKQPLIIDGLPAFPLPIVPGHESASVAEGAGRGVTD